MKKSGAEEQATGPLKEVFRQRLHDYRSEPDARVWERLELGLDRNQALQDKRRARFFMRCAAAILLLMATAGAWGTYRLLQLPSGELAQSNTTPTSSAASAPVQVPSEKP